MLHDQPVTVCSVCSLRVRYHDVFMAGVVIAAVATDGMMPFLECGMPTLAEWKNNADFDAIRCNILHKAPPTNIVHALHDRPHLRHLILWMLQHNPWDRPTIQEVVCPFAHTHTDRRTHARIRTHTLRK